MEGERLGLAVLEELTTKSADQLFDRGLLGVFSVILLIGLGFAGLVIGHLYRVGLRREERYNEMLERVIVVAENYKASTGMLATALEGTKSVQSSLVQAVNDLSREAEGESRETRHGIAGLMQVVTAVVEQTREQTRRIESLIDRVNNRSAGQ